MPYISIETGKLTVDQKRELIAGLTKTASQIIDVPEKFFMVNVKELNDENMGMCGETVKDIKHNLNKNR